MYDNNIFKRLYLHGDFTKTFRIKNQTTFTFTQQTLQNRPLPFQSDI